MALIFILGLSLQVCADSNAYEDFTHGKFIECYSEIRNTIEDITEENMSDEEKIEKICEYLEDYNIDEEYIFDCIDNGDYVHKKTRRILVDAFYNTMDEVFEEYEDDLVGRESRIKEVLELFHLDEEFSIQAIEIGENRYDDMLDNIFTEHYKEEEIKWKILRVVNDVKKRSRKSDQMKCVKSFYEDNNFHGYGDPEELLKVINKHSTIKIAVEQTSDYIMGHYNEKNNKDWYESRAKELIGEMDELLVWNAYYKIEKYLDENNIGNSIDSPYVQEIARYEEFGYGSINQAAEKEIFSHLIYKISDKKLHETRDFLDVLISKYVMDRYSREDYVQLIGPSITDSYMWIFKEYGFNQVKDIISGKEILDYYFDYDKMGYPTKRAAFVDYTRSVLKAVIEADLDYIIKNNNYDRDIICDKVDIILNGKEGYKACMDFESLDKLLLGRGKNDTIIKELFLDAIINCKSEEIDIRMYGIRDDIVGLLVSSDKRRDINKYLKSVGLNDIIDVDKLLVDVALLVDKGTYSKEALYNKYLARLEKGCTLSEYKVKADINAIINSALGRFDKVDMDYRLQRLLEDYGLEEYVSKERILEYYYNPELSRLKELPKKLTEMVESGVSQRFNKELQALKSKKMKKSERIQELKVILKFNHRNTVLSDNDLYNKYLK